MIDAGIADRLPASGKLGAGGAYRWDGSRGWLW
jgi:hypothetical protein